MIGGNDFTTSKGGVDNSDTTIDDDGNGFLN